MHTKGILAFPTHLCSGNGNLFSDDSVGSAHSPRSPHLFCLNHLKHEDVRRRHEEYVQQFGEEDDEDRVMREEVYRKIYILAKGLPEKCRRVFELSLEGKKNEEIAVTLNISELTVKAHKQNALRYFRERADELILLVVVNRIS